MSQVAVTLPPPAPGSVSAKSRDRLTLAEYSSDVVSIILALRAFSSSLVFKPVFYGILWIYRIDGGREKGCLQGISCAQYF